MTERMGMAPTEEQWRDACLSIIDAVAGVPGTKAVLVDRGTRKKGAPNSGETWIVEIAGTATRVVYEPKDAIILTVLDAQQSRPKNGKPVSGHKRQSVWGRVRASCRNANALDYADE
jgi:hypothetical protein